MLWAGIAILQNIVKDAKGGTLVVTSKAAPKLIMDWARVIAEKPLKLLEGNLFVPVLGSEKQQFFIYAVFDTLLAHDTHAEL